MNETAPSAVDRPEKDGCHGGNLGAFWMKFELASTISRDDAKTVAGLDALIATGYLTTTGKQAVLDNWPRTRT